MARKGTVVIVLLLVALVLATASLVGGNSFTKLQQLRGALSSQRARNDGLARQVGELKSEVRGIKTDDRALEKAARSELGMARPNELIFFFDEESGQRAKARSPELSK